MSLPQVKTDSPLVAGPAVAPKILRYPEPVASRRSFREVVSDFPSWFTSLVAHLLAFLLLASVTSRVVSTSGSSPLVLQFSMGEELETSSVIEVSAAQSQPESGDSEDLPNGEANSVNPPQPLSPSEQQPEENQESQPSPRHTAFMSPTALTGTQSKYAGLTARLRRPNTSVYANVDVTEPSNDPIQRQYDQIVDRFIQYDVGKLRGAAGIAANRAFRELGPEAFPALIRGLNRSANIHASCPVGVIAGKVL
ncbi:MAG: hypothetical protein KDB27_26085, partial [Planctomycetales bacterium]|nr:hypothetical protein [Planctomycetales bacterium]